MGELVNINDVLDGHVVLDLQCLDRVYLNGYVPKLQVAGQVVAFLTERLGDPIPSPVLFKQIGDRFREAVRSFAEANGIPLLHLNTPDRSRWDDRKVDHVREYVDQACSKPARAGRGLDEPGNRCPAVGKRPGIGHRAQEDRPRRTAGGGLQPIRVDECGQVGRPHVCLELCGLVRIVAGQDTPVVEQPAQRRGIGHAAPGTTSAGRQQRQQRDQPVVLQARPCARGLGRL